MYRGLLNGPLTRALSVLPVAFAIGCSNAGQDTAGQASSVEGAEGAKIEITTSNEEARDLFIEGRGLAERLRPLDGRPMLEEAVEKDPTFAAAYLLLAQTAPSNEEFFTNLELATANIDHASAGERLMTMAPALSLSCRKRDTSPSGSRLTLMR